MVATSARRWDTLPSSEMAAINLIANYLGEKEPVPVPVVKLSVMMTTALKSTMSLLLNCPA
ncbi:hypothetical protein CH63R_04791 [Colletotrichum higginsianum IMI 349063]|uniref:Uncharacterized protein n=1 Tax=Colletotrichum higginsianum (strain IMI 349063) TaxID=759273 RepID=A0A1B7YKG8_COLHI|nr:hypothetical protein CH63R_04791 [Colletotrichum higginsianum IMI 349063]OBR12495.1 hypothetical protein CH63R_04791 [Colletotrichum higginsianum IMI 349063]